MAKPPIQSFDWLDGERFDRVHTHTHTWSFGGVRWGLLLTVERDCLASVSVVNASTKCTGGCICIYAYMFDTLYIYQGKAYPRQTVFG